MTTTSLFIDVCWIGWILYWVLMAFQTKRTLEHGGFFGYRLVALIFFGGSLLLLRLLEFSTHSHLWRMTIVLGILADCVVLAGVAFTVWARITLGRNWSAEVTFKEDHELIESGPYALVRHPIYTGLLAMGLGTAINYGEALGFALFVGLCGGLWWKVRQEERIMSSHFPDSYADYKSRVHAIIPFLL